jgi:hypothetical protein
LDSNSICEKQKKQKQKTKNQTSMNFNSMKNLIVFMLLTCVSMSLAVPMVKDERYQQIVSERMTFANTRHVGGWQTLPVAGLAQVVHLNSRPQSGAVLSLDGTVHELNGDNKLVPLVDDSVRVQDALSSRLASARLDSSKFEFALVSVHSVFFCAEQGDDALMQCTRVDVELGERVSRVESALLLANGDALIGTDFGLYRVDVDERRAHRVLEIPEVRVSSLAETDESIAAGTDDKLWRVGRGLKQWFFWWTRIDVDSNVTALAFSPGAEGKLWIGNDEALNVQAGSQQGFALARIGGYRLPYGNITSIGQLGGTPTRGVWLGTRWGLERFDHVNSTGWRYLNGPRYLATLPRADGSPIRSEIKSLAVLAGEPEQVLAVTDEGVARIRVEWWTLAQKAEQLQSLVYPRHDRYNLTEGCSLASFGNLSSWQPSPEDNSGLWSSIYLASQAYRYRATGDDDARANAIKTFTALANLQTVTGLPGYPARSYAKYGDAGVQMGTTPHTWHNSTTAPGWVFKGDTSSDEICGHQYALPLFADMVAGAGTEQQRHAVQLVEHITGWIVENGYTLVGVYTDGQPTTWGRWNPPLVNHALSFNDQRGLNSLQMLSWLLSTSVLANNASFAAHYDQLVAEHHYDLNIVNQKVSWPADNNYSDNELAFLPFATWLHSGARTDAPALRQSLERTIDIVAPYRSSLWNVIYAAAATKLQAADDDTDSDERIAKLIGDAIWTLRSWPLEQIDWPVHNAHRFDLVWAHELNRSNRPDIVNLLRYDEINMFRWNGDPYSVYGNQGSGRQETDPSAFLLPYWMLRYYNFLSAPRQ